MKINMSQVQALYQATTDYIAKLDREISAKWRERRALRKQTLRAYSLCMDISDKISEESRFESLFYELISRGCSLETVCKILEDMGYEISDDILKI